MWYREMQYIFDYETKGNSENEDGGNEIPLPCSGSNLFPVNGRAVYFSDVWNDWN